MKNLLREIMYECFPFDPDFYTCFVDKARIEIAINEIEKLFKKQNPGLYTDWAGLDPEKWYELYDATMFDSEPE